MHNNHTNVRSDAQIHNRKRSASNGALDRPTILVRQARRWSEYVVRFGSMEPAYAHEKAMASVDYSIRQKANSLRIPSKLRGTSTRQEALLLVHDLAPTNGHSLELKPNDNEILVAFAGMTLGTIQPIHAWLRPLLDLGISVHLLRVTGTDDPRKTMGVNIVISGAAQAIARAVSADDVGNRDDADEIIFTRNGDQASLNIPHVRRNHPKSPDWSPNSPGAEDTAYSVLSHVLDERSAKSLYRRFARDVLSKLPREGASLSPDFVRLWATRQS